MTETLMVMDRQLLITADQNGAWLFCGDAQVFVNRTALEILRRLAAGETSEAVIRTPELVEALGADQTTRAVHQMVRLLSSLPQPKSNVAPGDAYAVAVVGGGPAGLMAAATAASHLQGGRVAVFDPTPGGSLCLVDSVTVGLVPGMAFKTDTLVSRLTHAVHAVGGSLLPHRVVRIAAEPKQFRLHLEHGESVAARAIVMAVGMVGPLYRACFRMKNVRDTLRSPYPARWVSPDTAILLIGTRRAAGTSMLMAREGYQRVSVLDICPSSTEGANEALWELETDGNTLLALRSRLYGCRTADLFLFDRSYFGPRFPQTTVVNAGGCATEPAYLPVDDSSSTPTPGIFACGDCVNGVLGVGQALAGGQRAGLAAASFVNPAAAGLNWARLPLELTELAGGGDTL